MKLTNILLSFAIAAAFLSTAAKTEIKAQEKPPASDKIYGQMLIDNALARHPEIATLAMHVTPPNGADNVIIASNIGRIGKKADEDDMNVVNIGNPNLEVNKNGDRFETELPLFDTAGESIGAFNCYDNAQAESFLSRFKAELVEGSIFKSVEQAKSEIFNYIEDYYNSIR